MCISCSTREDIIYVTDILTKNLCPCQIKVQFKGSSVSKSYNGYTKFSNITIYLNTHGIYILNCSMRNYSSMYEQDAFKYIRCYESYLVFTRHRISMNACKDNILLRNQASYSENHCLQCCYFIFEENVLLVMFVQIIILIW